MESFRNSIRKMISCEQKSLSLEKYFERKRRRHVFVVCVNLPTVKIWGQSGKIPYEFQLFTVSASSEKIDSKKHS